MTVLAISGSRADRGYLEPVARRLGCELLSGVVPPCFSADHAIDIAGAMGNALHRYTVELAVREPDLVVLCGDRWETMAAAHACTLLGTRIAHIGGGATTWGSYDDVFRDQISLACGVDGLHLVLTVQEGRNLHRRLYHRDVTEPPGDLPGDAELPEDCDVAAWTDELALHRIHVTGSPALSDLPDPVPTPPRPAEALVLIRPETADGRGAESADRLSAAVHYALEETFRRNRARAVWRTLWIGSCPDVGSHSARSLGCLDIPPEDRAEYLSVLAHADLVVGNSSSIVLESGFFGTPAVLVGARQAGRKLPRNVVEATTIREPWPSLEPSPLQLACERQLAHGRYPRDLTYGDGSGADRIAAVIKEYLGG